MLTNLTIRNFKRFEEVEVELGSPVVFIGPNNSGKTSAMQALALWDIGLKRWNERRAGLPMPEKRPGVTVNRRDLVAIPVPYANLLWHALRTRNVSRVDDRQRTENIRVDIIVDGVEGNTAWRCGLEFDYANQESFYCRPLRTRRRQDAGAYARAAGSRTGRDRIPAADVRSRCYRNAASTRVRQCARWRGPHCRGSTESLLPHPREEP